VGTRNDLFTAFAALHGPLVPDAFGERRPRVWLSTGSADHAWTPSKTRASEDQLKRSGFTDITFRLYPGAHTISKDEMAAVVAWWLGR
jgi:predicted esterase